MSILRQFLESTTIHGLAYIASTAKLSRLIWILVVIIGFSTAGFLIYQSFQSWEESPITTTIETLPISEIKFPKVSVCPPKNTLTNLNYDILKTKDMTLDRQVRDQLFREALEIIDSSHSNITKKIFRKVEDKNVFKNWYYGFSQMQMPYFGQSNEIHYNISTSATSGIL